MEADFLYKGERIIHVEGVVRKHTTQKRRIRLFAYGVSDLDNEFQIDLLSDKDKAAKWGFYHALAQMVESGTSIMYQGRECKGLLMAWLNANSRVGDSERGK